MQLTGFGASNRTSKIQLVAAEAKVEVKMNNLTSIAETKTESFLIKNPNGKIPLLETNEGPLFESNAIMRYVASQSTNSLLGESLFQKAQVQQHMDAISNEMESPVGVLNYGAMGYLDLLESTLKQANTDVNNQMRIYNDLLKDKQYLLGDNLSVADLFLSSVILPLYRFILDEKARKQHPHLLKWFSNVASLDSFKSTYGDIHFCKTPFPIASRKAEKKAAAPKKEPVKEAPKKKEENKDLDVFKAKVNPLDTLPESKFSLFDFKTLFVNHEDKKEAMKEFWATFDKEGYSLWQIKYDKYEGEGEKLHMTNNLVGGFIQRLDTFRKYSFGVHGVYGDEPKLDIKGCWIWRGTEIPFEMTDHVSYEYNFYTKLDSEKAEDRKLVEDYWCGQTEDESVVDGQTLRTFKYYK